MLIAPKDLPPLTSSSSAILGEGTQHGSRDELSGCWTSSVLNLRAGTLHGLSTPYHTAQLVSRTDIPQHYTVNIHLILSCLKLSQGVVVRFVMCRLDKDGFLQRHNN